MIRRSRACYVLEDAQFDGKIQASVRYGSLKESFEKEMTALIEEIAVYFERQERKVYRKDELTKIIRRFKE